MAFGTWVRAAGFPVLGVWLLMGSPGCFEYSSPSAKPAVLADAGTPDAGTSDCPLSCDSENDTADCDADGVMNVSDCAPCDSTRYRWVDADTDGDGSPDLTSGSARACAGAQIPTGYVAYSSPDCAPSDPTLFRKGCRDADLDGVCAPNSETCVGQDVPPGYQVFNQFDPTDCDDNDPTLQSYVYYDADGDGQRATSDHPSACVSRSDTGANAVLARSDTDCDDHDPNVNCSAVDLLFDGRDTNCDKDDGSLKCSQMTNASAQCPCWPRDTCHVSTTCGDRADLNIVDVEPTVAACSMCAYPYYQTSNPTTGLNVQAGGGNTARVLLVNSGGAQFDGNVMVGDKDNRYTSLETVLTLAPGESRIFDVSSLAGSVRLEIVSGDDCLSENNSADIPLGIPMCGD